VSKPPPGGNVQGCNQTIVQGADEDVDITVELGKTSGTVQYFFNTFQAPDNLTVTYQGNLLDITGCSATGPNGVPLNGPVGPYFCNNAICGRQLTYSGTSTQMKVHVDANCAGFSDTQWAFSISCP